jgi:hypothetical protein
MVDIKKVFSVAFLLGIVTLTSMVQAEPTVSNRIGLRIPLVGFEQEGVRLATVEAGTNIYEYTDKPLGVGDTIRYAWFGTNLSLTNVDSPVFGNGYLKIFLNDDSKPENFIANYGSSPLPVRVIAPRLTSGKNKILLVLVENAQGSSDPLTKVEFNFDYKPEVLPTSIDVISPAPGAVFASGITQDFTLKLNNFFLEKTDTKQPNKGLLEVYANDVTDANLLRSFSSSVTKDTYSEVSFGSNDLEKLQTVPDNAKTKLIFVLRASNGTEIPNSRKEFIIATNYGGTVDLGLPTIKIVSPVNNAEVTPQTKITLSVKNFELLTGLDTNNQKPGTGYIQIRINDKVVIENTSKTEFTLQDFGLTNYTGVTNLRADLVNQQFAFLQPAATGTVSLVVKKDGADTNTPAVTVSILRGDMWS